MSTRWASRSIGGSTKRHCRLLPEVDQLFARWKAAHAKIVSEPEDKPWRLREFVAADVDGNLIRVFYDFRRDV